MSFRNFLLISTSLALASAAAAGCVVTSEEPPPGQQYTYPTVASFCTGLATAECNDKVVETCTGADASTLEANRTKCVDAREASCNPQNLPKYSPAAADACIAKRKEVIVDAKLTRDEIEEAMEACLPVLSRGGADGSQCGEDVDCDTAAELRCVLKPGQATGICAIPETVGGGTKCDASNAVCADGFYCAADNHCLVEPTLSEMCSSAIPCEDSLKCDADTNGVCVAKGADIAPCAVDSDCAGGFCLASASGGLCASTYLLEFSSATCDDYR